MLSDHFTVVVLERNKANYVLSHAQPFCDDDDDDDDDSDKTLKVSQKRWCV